MRTLVAGIMAVALCAGMASQGMAQGTNTSKHAANHKGLFEQIDTNADGKLSWDEFLAYHTEKWQDQFQKRAANGNTKLTWEQVLAKRTAELKQHFQAMDTNSDGFVTKEEFRAYMTEHKGKEPHAGKPQSPPAATPSGVTNM